MEQEFRESGPMNHFVQSEDVADAVLFLCSEPAQPMTGQYLDVTAGKVMSRAPRGRRVQTVLRRALARCQMLGATPLLTTREACGYQMTERWVVWSGAVKGSRSNHRSLSSEPTWLRRCR
ncbi:MAG: SDR family oxidoreductase [Halobacteriales archaeon]